MEGTGSSNGKVFGDTTNTKVFVGGLAWETKREAMHLYFEQFGEILEAVIITDKNTGRSRGYGFVTFRDPDSARRACADPAPIIDGRRANCNLASLGSRRSQPCTPRPGNQVPVMTSFPLQTGRPGYPGRPTFPQHFGQYAFQEGFPYHIYGFSPYSTDYTYPPNYYNPYGGTQFPHIYSSQGMVSSPVLYPCYPCNQPLQTANGGSYPQAQILSVPAHVLQFPTTAPGNGISSLPQQTYGGIMSTPAAVPATTVSVLPNHTVQQYAVQPAIYHSKELIHQLKAIPLNTQQNEES